MSTFKIGDRVRVVKGNGYDLVAGLEVIVAGFEVNDGVPYVSISGHPDVWDIDRFEKVPAATEPEDTDDVEPEPLEVTVEEFAEAMGLEPEPLKKDDWVLVWMKYERTDNLHIVRAKTAEPSGVGVEVYVHPDAIVRPSAGQVPPWVNVATANVVAIARVLMDEGGMEHAAAFAHAESLDRAGIRAGAS